MRSTKQRLTLAILASFWITPPTIADQALAMKSGCMGCHKVDQKLVGPAFKDVAAKYASEAGIVDTLTARVKAGSPGGTWGPAPMVPSPAPEADVKQVVTWIMSLK